MTLLKHSNVEFGTEWWFLYRLCRNDLSLDAIGEIGLHDLKHTRSAEFLKRFSSEEELEIEAIAKYGAVPIDIDILAGKRAV